MLRRNPRKPYPPEFKARIVELWRKKYRSARDKDARAAPDLVESDFTAGGTFPREREHRAG